MQKLLKRNPADFMRIAASRVANEAFFKIHLHLAKLLGYMDWQEKYKAIEATKITPESFYEGQRKVITMLTALYLMVWEGPFFQPSMGMHSIKVGGGWVMSGRGEVDTGQN